MSLLKPQLIVIVIVIVIIILISSPNKAQAKCKTGCRVALASYYVTEGSNLTYISSLFGLKDTSRVLLYNPKLKSQDSISTGDRLRVPFTCDCLNRDFLGHTFAYVTRAGDRYHTVATAVFANLTTEDWVRRVNTFAPTQIPAGAVINVTVNCTCGDARVSGDYGLFATWPLLPAENLSSVEAGDGLPPGLLELYNPGFVADSTSGIVFVPAKDGEGKYPPFQPSTGVSSGVIGGISIAAIGGASLVALGLYFGLWRRKKSTDAILLPLASDHHDSRNTSRQGSGLVTQASNGMGSSGITMDKSVEFSYEELSKSTKDFSLDNKIGQGGFGYVYYAELRGEKVAIKKMDMQASKEFLAELKVLTHVHHLNLVRLIGYCVEGSLFLVYEYIENGNLSQHLRDEGFEPLSWTTRVQIALDSARGLEYIHEHTVPVYIHRDIKSANILIDRNYRGKVADFGLTKLTEYGSTSMQTRLVGTFGYMPPEYAQYGDVSTKVDVYAFGVVLYELISAKEAVVKMNEPVSCESKGLVALFEEILVQPDPQEDLIELVDPRLGKNYSIDSVSKMAQLAKACTQESPQLRPSMRSIVVALMTLSTTSEDWDVGSLYENQALLNLMTGR